MIAESVARNAERPEAAQVSERGILGAAGRLEVPDPSEGFARPYDVRLDAGGFVVDDWRPA